MSTVTSTVYKYANEQYPMSQNHCGAREHQVETPGTQQSEKNKFYGPATFKTRYCPRPLSWRLKERGRQGG
jgi:hypothetical protein